MKILTQTKKLFLVLLLAICASAALSVTAFADAAPTYSSVIYAGQVTGIGTEQTSRDGTLAYPYASMEDAVKHSSDGGIIYVVGKLDVSNEHKWSDDTTGKSLTIQAYPAATYAGVELYPEIAFSINVSLTGNMTFLGYVPGVDAQIGSYTSNVPLKMTFNSSATVNPNSYALQIGRIKDDRTLYTNEITSANTLSIASSSTTTALDVKLYTNANKSFSTSGSASLTKLDIDIVGGKLYGTLVPNMTAAPATGDIHISRCTGDSTFRVFGGSSALTSDFNVTFDNTTSFGNIRLGNINTTGDVTVNLTNFGVFYFYPTNSSTTASTYTYNLVNSTINRFYNSEASYYTYTDVTKTYNNIGTTVFNLTESKISEHLHYAVSNDGSYASPAIVVNFVDGTNSIATIFSHTQNYWQFNSNSTSATVTSLNRIRADINVSDDKCFTVGAQGVYGEIHDVNLGDRATLYFSKAFNWLSGDLNCSVMEESYIITPKRFDLAIKGDVTGSAQISITDVTSVTGAGANNVLVNFGANSMSEYIVYAGSPATENLLTYSNDGSRTYISPSLNPIAQSNAIYVRSSGSDSNDGTTYANAVATTKRAYEIAAASSTRKTIVVCGVVAYYFDEDDGYKNNNWTAFAGATNAGNVTITSHDGVNDFRATAYGAKLLCTIYAAGYTNFSPAYDANAQITVEEITFACYGNGYNNESIIYIGMCGNKTVFGDGVQTPSSTHLVGGTWGGLTNHGTNLTVYSGTYDSICGGNDNAYQLNGDIFLNVYGGTVSIIEGSYYDTVSGNITLIVGGVDGYTVNGVTSVFGMYYTTYANNVYVEVDGSYNSVTTVTSVFGLLYPTRYPAKLDVYVHDMPGNDNLVVVCGNGADRSVTVENVDKLRSIMGDTLDNGHTTPIDITVTHSTKTVITGGIYAQAGDKIYNGEMSADSFPTAITSGSITTSGTITLENVEVANVCGANNNANYALANITDRNLVLRGENKITQSIRQFTNVTAEPGSDTVYDGTLINAANVINSGSLNLTQDVTLVGNYSGSLGELHLATMLIINGKITGATELFANTATAGCSVVATTYNATNVPPLTNAFYGEGITFTINQPASGNGTWEIVPIPFTKQPVIYVRDTNGAEAVADYALHDGSDYDHAVYTLAEAFIIVDTSSGEGTIVICGPLAQANNWTAIANSNTVVLTSVYGGTDYRTEKGATLNLTGDSAGTVTMNGNWTIKNLDIRYTTTANIGIDANGYTLIVGTNATPDIFVDKTEGARRWNGSEWVTVNDTAAYVQPDVTIYRDTNTAPSNFFILGGGLARTTVDKVDVRIYNTTVGQLIGMYQNSTVNGDYNVVCRDSFILWKTGSSYGNAPSVSFCAYPGIATSTTAPTGTVKGNATVAIERYMKNSAYTSSNFPHVNHSRNTKVSGNGERLYANKCENKASIYGLYNSFAICANNYYELYDGLDNSNYGFSLDRFTVQNISRASSKKSVITFLGGNSLQIYVKSTWSDGGSVDRYTTNNCSNTNLSMNFGNEARGSYVSISRYPFIDDYSSTGYFSNTATFDSVVFNVYPGTSISGSTATFQLDNYNTNYQYLKGETYALKDVENGYGKWVFHSSTANPNYTYNLSSLRKFAIEADGCTVKVNDTEYICTGMTARNGGIIMLGEDGSESSWKQLNITKSASGNGGNLAVINDGKIINYSKTTAATVAGCVTVKNAELDATAEKLTFGTYYAHGDARLLLNEGTTLSIGYLETECGTTEVNYVPNSNPTSTEAGATIAITREGQTEDKFVAGKNTNGTGADLNALNYNVTGIPSYYDATRLPSKYQEVEYLQSTGTQWIDTGVNFYTSTHDKIVIEATWINGSKGAFGAFGSPDYISHNLTLYDGNIYFGGQSSAICGNIFKSHSYPLYINGYIEAIGYDVSYSFNNETYQGSATAPVGKADVTTMLFTQKYQNKADQAFTQLRLNKLEMYNNVSGTYELVRNLIPCYRKSDSKPGMYDLVNGVFYTNQGTGEFLVGADVAPFITDCGTTSWTVGGGAMGEKFKIYLKDDGDDAQNGGSQGASVKTLGRAFEEAYKRYNGTSSDDLNLLAAEKAKPTFYVTVCGKFHLQSLATAYSAYYDPTLYNVVLTQLDTANSAQNTVISETTVSLPATMTVQAINVRSSIPETELFACGHKLTFGEDISTNCSDTKRISIYGGAEKAHTLPDEYQEVEYLQSTSDGKQWIDTGFKPNQDTWVECDFLIPSYATPQYTSIFGSRTTFLTSSFDLGSYFNNEQKFWTNYNGQYPSNNGLVSYKEMLWHVSWNKNIVRIYNDTYDYNVNMTYQTFSTNANMRLFGRSVTGDSVPKEGIARIYTFTLYDNGTLIRDFIPCYRKSDSEPGMYDLVNGVFYTNQGTGEFIMGNEINAYAVSSTNITVNSGKWYRIYGGNKNGNMTVDAEVTLEDKGTETVATLPDEYTEVEYLQSTGTQWIDTGLTAKCGYNVSIDFQYIDTSYSQAWVFGEWSSSPATLIGYYINNFYVYYGKDDRSCDLSPKPKTDTNRHVAGWDENGYYWDGVLYSSTKPQFNENFSNNIWLIFNRSVVHSTTKAKVYSCSIYNGTTPIRNFIPCYRKSDSKPGMYDTVNDVFYTNAGTGEFILGPEGSFNNGIIRDTHLTVMSSSTDTGLEGDDIHGVFGGSKNGNITGNVTINVKGGEYYGYIYGGGYGKNGGGLVTGNTVINITGNSTAQRIYGGGCYSEVDGDTEVNLKAGTAGRIYGGGMMGASEVSGTATVNIGYDGSTDTAKVTDFLRGSGALSGVGVKSVLNIKKGAYLEAECDVCAGGYTGSAPESELNVTGGTVLCNIYAGSAGEYGTTGTGRDYGKIKDDKGKVGKTTLNITDGVIEGNIYGGGNKGYVGDGTNKDEILTLVNIEGGTVNGNIYAGCNLATVYGNSKVVIDGTATVTGKVFGGGKGPADSETTAAALADTTIGNVVSDIRTNNGALTTGTTNIEITSGDVSGNIYGGCDVRGEVDSTIITATMIPDGDIFGGGYGKNTNVKTLVTVSLDSDDSTTDCTVYGGGELGKVQSVAITVDEWSGDVYGGGKGLFEEDVLTDATVNNGTQITVNGTANGKIYGGGEVASVVGGTTVIVASTAEVTGDVFGGGKGTLNEDHAKVASTTVQINGKVTGDIFGGGELASVGATNGTIDVTSVTVANTATINGTVYGGGKGDSTSTTGNATINGNTVVTLNGDVNTVFGGGKIAPVAGNTNVLVQAGNFENVFGGNDVAGEVSGTPRVTVTGGTTDNVYGGGRDAAHSSTTNSTEVTINITNPADSVTNAYGGGYGATATVNKAHITLVDGKVTNIYGGGEKAVTVNADVDITGGTATSAYAGGKLGNTTNADIDVTDGTVTNVYGGGDQATVTTATTVHINTSDDTYHVTNLFAGNNKAAMAIKPTLDLADGKIKSAYLGGNEGVMTTANSYTFDYPDIVIDELYAGCNNTGSTVSADTTLTLKSGTYTTVYGGNNTSGRMNNTNVIVDKDSAKTLTVATVYGGGNQAESKNTHVTLTNGEVTDVYGGGNNATATGLVELTLNDTTLDENPNVTNLYCGNNAKAMNVAPVIELTSGKITNFYGGGNQGAMTCPDGLVYTFDSDDVTIDTVYGAGNQAGVTTKTTLNVNDGNITTIYGGSNAAGTTNETVVNINTDIVNGTVFGGGKGSGTRTTTTNVNILNGTISGDGLLKGNVYGGSGYGKVGTANVTLKESTDIANAKVVIEGNVFGGGYGLNSTTNTTNVLVNLKLDIATQNSIGTNIGNASTCDVLIKEEAKASGDKTGESKVSVEWKTPNHSYTDVSRVNGSVFGGADMGKIGEGSANPTNNIAYITTLGSSNVTLKSGYIHGNLFGGGNGQPSGEKEDGTLHTYTSDMGNVFGTNNVNVYGGYVGNSVFGCGLQSKTYSGSDGQASNVNIDTTNSFNNNLKAIVIGESVFGGGNKGSGNDINASVSTTFGKTHVTIKSKQNEYAHIYFVSNGTTGGGIYGDGNLSKVDGEKTIDLENFSCGLGNASRLKTFYSLQRADVVNLVSSRVVLKGAIDLVAEDQNNTVYSINRVRQLNMKQSSTIKVVKKVNCFGELTSDFEYGRQFITLGKNNGNNINGESENFENNYTAHGATSDPSKPLTAAEMNAYRAAYNNYASTGAIDSTYNSINVVAVGNGGSIEVTRDTNPATESTGAVKGLFTLQLVDAVAGEGGGFVYADITNSTGNFVCVTMMDEAGTAYMYVYHNVGGIYDNATTKYEYYYWYLRGGKLSYDVSVEAIIGTDETDYEKYIVAPSDRELRYILSSLTFTEDATKEAYIKSLIQDSWDAATDKDKTVIAIELMVETVSTTGTTKTSVGYVGLGNVTVNSETREVWGINTTSGFIASRDYMTPNLSFIKGQIPTLCYIDSDCTGVRFYFVLHKGTGVTEEFRNYPFELTVAQVPDSLYNSTASTAAINDDTLETKLRIDLFISAIRVVPSQSAYISNGRLYGGVASTTQFMVTGESSFTAQFITKYVPSAFNTVTTNKLNDEIVFAYNEVYLLAELDTVIGGTKTIGITATNNGDGTYTITHIADADDVLTTHYTVQYDSVNDKYQVNYHDGTEFKTMTDDVTPVARWYDCTLEETRTAGFKLPKNTVVTLLASVNEGNPTYWYYYCTNSAGTSSILLSDFCRMNSALGTNTTDNANQALFSSSSTRITEDLIFIFNFSNVTDTNWTDAGNVNKSTTSDTIYSDNLMVKHNYTATVGGTFDIMDFVQKTTDTGNVTVYNHIAPKNTDNFKLSLTEKAILNFTVEVMDSGEAMSQNCNFDIKFNVIPNSAVINTQYDERVFAILLQLKDGSGNVIEFPDGTVFTYKNQMVKTGLLNKYVIIPIRTTGEHVLTVDTELYGFDVGNYTVTAQLYSTTADGYYNSLQVIDEDGHTSVSDTFSIIADPVYKLSIEENSGKKNRVVAQGDTFDFTVTAGVVGTAESDDVGVNVYKFDADNNQYVLVNYSDVFTDTPAMTTGTDISWTPQLTGTVDAGTYRIELTYNTCTEYWDFIVE